MAAVLFALLATLGPADSLAGQGRWYFNHRHLNGSWLDSAASLAARARTIDRFADAAVALDCDVRLLRATGVASRAGRLARFRAVQALADSMRAARAQSPVGHFFWATATRTWRTTFLTRVLRLWLRNRRFSFCRARFRAEICLAKAILRY